jgi:NAD(P)H-flavin reductase
VVGQRYLSPTVVHLSVDVGPDFDFEGGQFVRFETAEGLKRSYSIATPTQDRRGILDFHIRLIPDGAMSEIVRTPDVIGREFQICGPMGSCVYELESSEPILMIASGTGLAPLYAILQDALHHEHPAPIWLYHGSATADGLYLCEELSAMASEFEQFTYVPCADTVDCPDDQTLRVGSPLILALVDHPDLTGVRVYSCGHPTLVRLAQKKCYIAGADLSRIHIDAFEPQNS